MDTQICHQNIIHATQLLNGYNKSFSFSINNPSPSIKCCVRLILHAVKRIVRSAYRFGRKNGLIFYLFFSGAAQKTEKLLNFRGAMLQNGHDFVRSFQRYFELISMRSIFGDIFTSIIDSVIVTLFIMAIVRA